MERGMQFITALFGGTDNTVLNAAFALGLVLVLVVLGLWVLKFATSASANLGRPGKRRLSVIDSAVVDGKRKVIIIRRDNVEHVIMTGGPADLVIETGLPVAEPPPRRAGPQKPPRRPTAPSREPEVAAPPAHDHKVSREAVDRLRDLARPAPLKPIDPARFRGLMRSDIPTGPQLRVDNSAGPSADSARTAIDGTDGPPRFAGRNRFFRSITRREQG